MRIFDIFKKKPELIEAQEEVNSQEKDFHWPIPAVIGSRVEYWGNKEIDSYKSHFAIYRGINLLADSLAQLPLDVYKGETKLDQGFMLPNRFDLHMPNTDMSLNELLYNGSTYLFYRGEFMLEIVHEPFFELRPINPRHMTLRQDGVWEYRTSKERRIIPKENLIITKLFNPDGDRGLGPVDVVKAEIMNDSYALEYNTQFFKNFGKIGGVLEDTNGKATTEDMTNVVNQFNNAHAGSGKAYGALGLPKGISYNEISQSIREMEFLESRKDVRDKILITLGIHKSLVGITDQVNRSVSEEATRQLWSQTVKPNAIKIQEKLNQHLFRRYFPGYNCQFNFDAIAELQDDLDTKLDRALKLRMLGYTTNEINRQIGLDMDEITDASGDMRFIPTSMVPVDDMLFEPEVDSSKSYSDTKLDKAIDDFLKEEHMTKEVKGYVRNYNRLYRKSEKKFEGKLRKQFSRQLGLVMGIVKPSKSIKNQTDADLLLSMIRTALDQDKDKLGNNLKEVYNSISKEADGLAINFTNSNAEAVTSDLVVDKMVNNIKGINNTTYNLIKTQVKNGVEAGEAIDTIADRVTKVFKTNAARAKVIARTETQAVVNRTTDERYKKAGVQKKQWLSAGDGSVRATHAHNHERSTVTYNHTYSNGQQFPGDGGGGAGENVNCRCTFIPVIGE